MSHCKEGSGFKVHYSAMKCYYGSNTVQFQQFPINDCSSSQTCRHRSRHPQIMGCRVTDFLQSSPKDMDGLLTNFLIKLFTAVTRLQVSMIWISNAQMQWNSVSLHVIRSVFYSWPLVATKVLFSWTFLNAPFIPRWMQPKDCCCQETWRWQMENPSSSLAFLSASSQ